ncbi:MAG: amidophosphoribosyltransferase [Planctomycetaceae bacterium]
MAELHHECGIAAIYKYAAGDSTRYISEKQQLAASRLIPRVLLDIQNRGQLAAGMTVYRPKQKRLLTTHKDVGTVTEVFHLNHPEPAEKLLSSLEGVAAIGHVRYATCGKDDPSYAQPFEREHIEKRKWFAFGFNGQLANYLSLRQEILSQDDFHLARETDTEILMHLISQEISAQPEGCDLIEMMKNLSGRLDGAYNIVFLNAMGQMMVARDPLGFRPLVYADQGGMFAAASESVALSNLGFDDDHIHDLPPGCAVLIENGSVRVERFAESPRRSHCFFEWIYFANVASTMDERSVYLARKRLGEELARQELVTCDADSIVVPVPDTAKAAADAMAFELGIPCLEGLFRNRYVGRTFIEGADRIGKAQRKYTPLRHVLEGKRVFLVEDSIVRSTTLRVLIKQLYERGGAKEVHVRVACPPIIAPCYYGIDISQTSELFAPKFLKGDELNPEYERAMAKDLDATTLRYLSVDTVSRAIGIERGELCQACIDTSYPTPAGEHLYQLDIGRPADACQAADGLRPLERALVDSVR